MAVRYVRALRKHWRPFRHYAWTHSRTWREWGRTIVLAGVAWGFLIDDQLRAFIALNGLWLLLYLASVRHWISCYRASLHKNDEDQGDGPPEDRYELVDGRETFRRYPWLPK